MSLKAMTLDEVSVYLKLLIYGPQGIGKTFWTAENCPKPAVWMDFERSSDTILSNRDRFKTEDFKIIQVTPDKDPKEVEDFCKNIHKTEFKTIIFDTMTTSQVFQLDHWMNNGSKNKGHSPTQPDYRESTTVFQRMFLRLQHAPINVVLIAHEREMWIGEGPSRRISSVIPSVTPALHDAVTQLVSGVFRLSKKNGKYQMLTETKGLYIAKNRYGIADVEVIDPTWNTFLKGMTNA